MKGVEHALLTINYSALTMNPILRAQITVASPKSSTRLPVRDSTPRPIHVLRCYVPHTCRTLSEARFDRYSSGSQSFVSISLNCRQS